jgi:elongator complex protein 3
MPSKNLTALTLQLIKLAQTGKKINLLKLQRQYPKAKFSSQPFYPKAEILATLKNYSLPPQIYSRLHQLLQVKPVRTQSGVATITVLTKPWFCPGKCIFCPSNAISPKSYLPNEPGAARAQSNFFDPYLQVVSRLKTLDAMGHNLDKIEVIILGGSWDSYPLSYRLWFITQIFQALNDFSQKINRSPAIIKKYQTENKKLSLQHKYFLSNDVTENLKNWQQFQVALDQDTLQYNELPFITVQNYPPNHLGWHQLEIQQLKNQKAKCRNVGLVIETRPDLITEKSLKINRKFGCTKIQIGVQSLNDKILRLNQREMTVAKIAHAFALLRLFGFKIHAHFMANLYGATPLADIKDYHRLVTDPRFLPDEVKLYPCSLLASTKLNKYYQQGKWHPYRETELLQILVQNMIATPRYVRITRMIRDFSSHDIIAGNKKTNFRQLVDAEIKKQALSVKEIRTREISREKITLSQLQTKITPYDTTITQEIFLEFITPDDKIVGFLRLSLPKRGQQAMIRELHVYGVAANLGAKGKTQHLGLGKKLMQQAQILAADKGFTTLSVISAVGTREYYRKLGFHNDGLYQNKTIM